MVFLGIPVFGTQTIGQLIEELSHILRSCPGCNVAHVWEPAMNALLVVGTLWLCQHTACFHLHTAPLKGAVSLW